MIIVIIYFFVNFFQDYMFQYFFLIFQNHIEDVLTTLITRYFILRVQFIDKHYILYNSITLIELKNKN